MQWKDLRHTLMSALETLGVVEIYMIERENNLVTICIILNDGGPTEGMRKLTQLNIIDGMIERKAPEAYRQFLFIYEVWEKALWLRQKVKMALSRQL